MADRLVRPRRLDGRIVIGGWSYVIATLCFVPALLSRSLVLSLPLFVVAAAGLAARNPPLDAARLDIMDSRLRGRAEAVRTVLRRAGVASAPCRSGCWRTPSTPDAASPRQGSTGLAPTPADSTPRC